MYRDNPTLEEKRLALIDDSYAYGIGVLVSSLIQFIVCAIGIDLVNISALKQVKLRVILFMCSHLVLYYHQSSLLRILNTYTSYLISRLFLLTSNQRTFTEF